MAVLIEGLESAFGWFGEVPRELLFDQMREVVLSDDRAGGANKLKHKNLTGKTRFTALRSAEIDMLSRTRPGPLAGTWTLQPTFVGINYYDGQGFQRARRRVGMHPDRHHHRVEPRGLLPRQQHEV